MKFSLALSTLATLTIVNALPNAYNFEKRQFNNQTFTNTTSTGGAGVGAQNTGGVTQTVTQTVVSTVSQLYTTYPVTSTFTETIVIPAGGAGVAPAATNAPGSGSSPNVVVVAAPGSGTGTGTGAGAGAGAAAASCVCSAPAVVATGIYTVTVQNIINLGTTTITTAYPTTTLGLITIAGGSVVPAVATVTNSAVIAYNTNAALAPGQSYQTITIPGTSQTIVVIVTVVTEVVAPVGNNGGAGAGAAQNSLSSSAPYSNSTMTATSSTPSGGAGVAAAAASSTSSAAVVGTPVSATGAPVNVTPAPQPTTTAAAAATPAPGTNAVQVGSLGTTPLYNQDAFINDILSYHNTLRARNNAPAMTWNADLAQQALANVNMNAAAGTFDHTTNDPYGENIAYADGYNNPEYLVWVWYEENTSYSYSNPVFSDATGHFTQLVWVDSTELGCAFTQASSNGRYFLACEYSPPGNYANEFAANVLPPTSNDQPAQPATNI